MPLLLQVLRDLGVPAVAAGVVILLGSLISRGVLHRTDRLGAAAIAVAFAVGYQGAVGGGFDAGRLVSLLPMVAVVGALLLPRILARAAPDAGVGAPTRAGLVVAGVAGAVALHVAGAGPFAGLALARVGGALGLAVATQVGDREPIPIRAPDARPGTWLLVAALLVKVWAFAAANGAPPLAVALLTAAVVAAPLAARRGGTVGGALAVGLPAGLGIAAVVVAAA